MTLTVPQGCCDDNDPMLEMARYMVRSAFKEALRDRSDTEIAVIVMGCARIVAIDLLRERGMNLNTAKQLVTDSARMLENMTRRMAREAGLSS
jgi:hypothetical protein